MKEIIIKCASDLNIIIYRNYWWAGLYGKVNKNVLS
jgi:hypothetical protein